MRHNGVGEGGIMDKKIKSALEGIGAEWTGQGTDLTTNVRDISFDLKAK